MNILITGATGFLGSNITEKLLNLGHKIYATSRNLTDYKNVLNFKKKVIWINTDCENWGLDIKNYNIDYLIHLAWTGITSEERNNWDLQIKNFYLSKIFFDLAKECNFKKVIAFGSQAEYGSYNFNVNENNVPIPGDAYGSVKVFTLNYLRNLCKETEINWYWLRVYSVFGKNENPNWLIPSVILKLIKMQPVYLTNCEQEYNYLSLDNFLNYFMHVIYDNKNNSGVYNLCNNQSIKLKDLIIRIAKLLNISHDYLKFGAIPYRKNQNMFISGDNSKFIKNFVVSDNTENSIDFHLVKLIKYYQD